MPKPRKSLIAVESTLYYYCVARCVRRAFLCGQDLQTGKNYEHRRGWLESRLLELPNVFAIDVASYAIMSNHYHAVLHINTLRAKSWSDLKVVERWHMLFRDGSSPYLVVRRISSFPKWNMIAVLYRSLFL